MGWLLKEEYEWTVGASAVVKDIELAKAPIHAVILNCDVLGNAAAATLANALTQFGTLIYLKDGGSIKTPKWTAAELLQYQELFFNKNVPFQDGTAADNKLALMQLILPMGRPYGYASSAFPLPLLDPLVGWNPSNTPYLHMEVPADGNSLDNRHVKVVVLYKTSPFAYDKSWTEWTSQTVSTTGYTDWTIGDKGLWLEALLFETSGYNGTLTSDAPSIIDARIERNGKMIGVDGDIPNVFGATLDDDTHADDNYKYICLSQAPFNDFSQCIVLSGETKFRVKGGVADAVTMAFSRIAPNKYVT